MRTLHLGFLLLLTTPAAAQNASATQKTGAAQKGSALAELPRAKAIGMVRDAGGKPWAGVKVYLLARTVPAGVRGEVDQVVTSTDARGQFRAEILTGRTYTCWAVQELPDQRFRCTNRISAVAGMAVLLEERSKTAHRRLVSVGNTDRFKDRLPVSVWLIVTDANRPFLPLVREKEGWRMPLAPAGPCSLLVIDKHKRTLGHRFVRTKDWWQDSPIEIKISGQRGKRLVRVHDGFKGPPVAGATVCLVEQSRFLPLAKTDEDGWAEFDVPLKKHEMRFLGQPTNIAIWKSGFQLGALRGAGGLRSLDKPLAEKQKAGRPDFITYLKKGYDVTGRLFIKPGVPAINTALTATVVAASYTSKNSSQGMGAARTFWTDKDGRFVLKGAIADESFLVRCSLDKKHLAMLPAEWHENLSPQVVLGVAHHGKANLGDVVIQKMAPVDLRIHAVGKTPGSGARIALRIKDSSVLILRADRRGRLKIILPNRVGLEFGVGHESGFRIGHLYKTQQSSDPIPCELRLRPPLLIRGRVTDAASKGLAGAKIRLSGDWPGEIPTRPEFEAKAGAHEVQLQDAAGRRVYYRLLSDVLLPRPSSGQDGSFVLAAPRCDLLYKISAGFTTPAGKYMSIKTQVSHDGSEVEEVELQFSDYKARR